MARSRYNKLPDVPQITSTPTPVVNTGMYPDPNKISYAGTSSAPATPNPLQLYANAGIQTKPVNGMNIPIDLESLKKGIQDRYNFGDPQLANLYKSPLYNQESFLNGIENQNRNYGSNVINKTQSFLPKIKTGMPEIPINNQQPLEEVVTAQQTAPKKSFGSKVGSFLNNPITRGALVAAVVGATGGGALPALTYGLSTGTQFAQNKQNDKFNRELLTQSGVDPNTLPKGFISDDMLKNYTTLENAKFNREYKQEYLNALKERINNNRSGYKDVIDIYYNQGLINDASYNELKNSDAYLNNTTFQGSTINKFLEPYLITKRGTQAVKLEGTKQGNRKEIETIKNTNRLGQITASAQAGGEQQRKTASYKENLPSVQANTKKDVITAQNAQIGNAGTLKATTDSLNAFAGMLDKVPNKTEAISRTPLRAMNLKSDNETRFDAFRAGLVSNLSRSVAGEKGVLTDQDIKRIENLVPTLNDSYAQRVQKMNVIKEMINNKSKLYSQFGVSQPSNNTDSIRQKLKSAGYNDNQINSYLKQKGY